jgi:hypothetical protein
MKKVMSLSPISRIQATNSGDRPFFLYHKNSSDRGILIGGPILGRLTSKWYLP